MTYANEKNLIRCPNCRALYDKTVRWSYGYYSEGTYDEFYPRGTIKENCCPICSTENVG